MASYYRENITGTKLDRPELGRLLMDSHRNDIFLVEQIDRLPRLNNSDWSSRTDNSEAGVTDEHGVTGWHYAESADDISLHILTD